MIAKEGWPIIGLSFVITIVLAAIYWFTGQTAWLIITLISVIILVFHFFFFRDPDRKAPQGDNLIISPADGTIILIEEVEEPQYFKSKVRKVSIFLSVFNVHVNRIPFNGSIDYVDYMKGKFLAAFADDASDLNEQSKIAVKSDKGSVYFKQIAGLIARRIIYNVKAGDKVEAGKRFGLIRYGSRVDLFFPLSVKLHVKLKDKVRCGSTIIGEF